MKIDKKILPIFLTINKSKQALPTLYNQHYIKSTMSSMTASKTSNGQQYQIMEENSNDSTGVSLCIPFVYTTVTKERVFAVIKSQNVGFIEQIDIVKKDEKHNRVFIHFSKNKWGGHPNYNATDVMMNLKAGIPWIVPYSRNGYWKIWISNVARPGKNNQSVPRVKRKQCLDLSVDTLKHDFKENLNHNFNLNDPIQARIYASIPIQCP